MCIFLYNLKQIHRCLNNVCDILSSKQRELQLWVQGGAEHKHSESNVLSLVNMWTDLCVVHAAGKHNKTHSNHVDNLTGQST